MVKHTRKINNAINFANSVPNKFVPCNIMGSFVFGV